MRLALLVAAWLLCPVLANAQSAREQLTIDWWLLTANTSGVTEQERTAHAIDHGVDATVASKLVALVDLGNKQLKEFAIAEKHNICDNQKVYASDREALARALDRTDTLEEAILKSLFNRMDANMKAGAMMLVEHGRQSVHVSSDGRSSGDAMRAATGDLSVYLNEVCSRPDEPAEVKGAAK